MMFGPLQAVGDAIKGLERGHYRLDAKLVEDLYRACSPRQKVELALTPVLSRLPPNVFKRIFMDAHRRARPAEKHPLAISLHAFLDRHPRRANEYAREILELLRSGDRNLFIIGVGLVSAFFEDISEKDLQRVKRTLKRDKYLRLSALHGLASLLSRQRRVSARVSTFLLSAEIRRLVEDIRSRDAFRHNRHAATEVLEAQVARYNKP